MSKLLLLAISLTYLYAQSIQLTVLSSTDSVHINDLTISINNSVFAMFDSIIYLDQSYTGQNILIQHVAFDDTIIFLKQSQRIFLKPKIYISDLFTVYDDFIKINKRKISINETHSNNTHLSNILDLEIGLSPSSYGGSGTLSEVKIRGSSANHSIVLIEGIRQNNFQNGSYNLANVTSLNVEQIEVYQDGASSQFGSDAMAGALNLKLGNSGISQFETYSSLGSFQSKLFENKLSYQVNANWNFQFAMHYDQADNNFAYLKNNSELAYRNGADHERKEFQSILIYNSSDWLWKTILKINKNNSGAPGPKKNLNTPYKASAIRQIDQSTLFISKLFYLLNSNTSFNGSVALNPQSLQYLSSLYKNDQNTALIEFNHQNKQWYLKSKLEYRFAKLNGNTGQDEITGQRGMFSLNQQVTWIDQIYKSNFALDLNIRQEWQDKRRSPSLYEMIAKNRLFGELFFNIRYAKHFRTPTFNELYWPSAGNPNLSKESGITRSIGLNLNLLHVRSNLNFFYSSFNNLIVWTNTNLGQLTVLNLKSSEQKGIQFRFSYRFNSDINVSVQFLHNRSIQNNAKSPNVVPNELIAKANYSSTKFGLFISWKWSDQFPVFNTSLLHPIRNDFQLITNYKFIISNDLKANINLKINNLLDEYSPAFVAFPRPNRNINFGIKLTYQLKGTNK